MPEITSRLSTALARKPRTSPSTSRFIGWIAVVSTATQLCACTDSAGVEAPFTGSWSYTRSSSTGCESTGRILDLRQNGDRLTGSYREGTVTCPLLGTFDLASGSISDGRVAEDSVFFTLGVPHEGRLLADSIVGRTVGQFSSPGGTFIARRR